MSNLEGDTGPINRAGETDQEPDERPMQAHFLREIISSEKKVPEIISVRNWNITVTYWASDGASHTDIGDLYGIAKSRVRSVIVSTMAKLWHTSPIETQQRYPLEILISSKKR